MTVISQADADLRHAIRLGLLQKDPRIDFQSATGTIPDGMPDLDVLKMASAAGRVLVNNDRKTMVRHFREFTATQVSPGLILARQTMPIKLVIEQLYLIWSAQHAEELVDRVVWLPF